MLLVLTAGDLGSLFSMLTNGPGLCHSAHVEEEALDGYRRAAEG